MNKASDLLQDIQIVAKQTQCIAMLPEQVKWNIGQWEIGRTIAESGPAHLRHYFLFALVRRD